MLIIRAVRWEREEKTLAVISDVLQFCSETCNRFSRGHNATAFHCKFLGLPTILKNYFSETITNVLMLW